jgi:hypothetical protein
MDRRELDRYKQMLLAKGNVQSVTCLGESVKSESERGFSRGEIPVVLCNPGRKGSILAHLNHTFSRAVPCTTMSCRLQAEEAMRPDRVEVSWDTVKSKWLVRIGSGEEVIRRHFEVPKDADDQTLRSSAQKTVEDGGYEPAVMTITVRR